MQKPVLKNSVFAFCCKAAEYAEINKLEKMLILVLTIMVLCEVSRLNFSELYSSELIRLEIPSGGTMAATPSLKYIHSLVLLILELLDL